MSVRNSGNENAIRFGLAAIDIPMPNDGVLKEAFFIMRWFHDPGDWDHRQERHIKKRLAGRILMD